MFAKPRSAPVGKPSLVASSSGSAKKARYARLLPSTRKSSASRAGASLRSSSAPVSVFGDTLRVYGGGVRFPVMRRAVWMVAVALVVPAGVGVGLAFALRPPPPRPYVAAAPVGKLRVSIPRGFYRY